MMFLRKRQDKIERVYRNDNFTAREKGHALFVLGGEVVVAKHPYYRDPASGSGNCWCGRDQSHTLHHVIVEE
jgi:hypothetical protein